MSRADARRPAARSAALNEVADDLGERALEEIAVGLVRVEPVRAAKAVLEIAVVVDRADQVEPDHLAEARLEARIQRSRVRARREIDPARDVARVSVGAAQA